MRRKVITSIAGGLSGILLLFATSASASVKAGSSCTKINHVTVSAGFSFTCLKFGKKLAWSKGVKTVTPVPMPNPSSSSTTAVHPTPTQTPTPTPTPTPSTISGPIPIPTPSEKPIPVEPKTFDDLIAHNDSVIYWSWKKASDQIKNAKIDVPQVNFLIGPNSSLNSAQSEQSISTMNKLYEGFSHPLKTIDIAYNFADTTWAQNEFSKYALRTDGVEASRQCSSDTKCMGALAEIDMRGVGIILETVPSLTSNWPAPVAFHARIGLTDAHEYAHDIQATQFIGTSKEQNAYCCSKAYMPWWMVEGNANYSSYVGAYINDFQSYVDDRKSSLSEVLSNLNHQFSVNWFQNYLDTTSTIEWNKPENQDRMYDIGQMVNEIFASIKGPAVNMQLFKDVANGKTWDQAFEINFGISWQEALPKIAVILDGMVSH